MNIENKNEKNSSQADLEYVEKKAALLLEHKQRYYSGKPSIPDEAFDALEDELRAIAPDHPVFRFVGYDVSSTRTEKVSHDPLMLSLSKSYQPAEILNFVTKVGKTCIADKLDGMALSLEYNAAGELERASTRGNGEIGENVSAHVLLVPAVPKKLNWLRLSSRPLLAEVRGEVFFPTEAFEKFSDRFESFRNAVPGTFGRKDAFEAADVLRTFKFCAYDLLLKDEQGKVLDVDEFASELSLAQKSHFAKLKVLESWGFWCGVSSGETVVCSSEQFENELVFSEFLASKYSKKRPYQIDGLVIRCDDEVLYQSLGSTSHHPRGSIAFKQSGETAVTELKAIHMGVGRSGKISFRAELSPVSLAGATIGFATLHNAEFIETGGYAPGATVRIKRSGEVIPYIIGVEQRSSQNFSLPRECFCGFELTRLGPDLFCMSNPECPFKDSEALLYFVKSLEIYGVSEKLLEKFQRAGLLDTPSDLFQLTVEDLLTLEGFGQKSAQNVFDAIQAKRVLPLHVFLTALGLKRGGKVKCFEVAKKFMTLEKVLNITAAELMELDGWAEKSALDFVESLHKKSLVIKDLLQYVTVLDVEPVQNVGPFNVEDGQQQSFGLKGKKICITGSLSRPRSYYEDLLRAAGAALMSSVTSATDFLVCNEASSSTKYVKAQNLGVPVLTEDDFVKKFFP